MSQRRSANPDPAPAPNDAELSRITREAVRQPADPRLDRQLVRMGLTGTSEPAGGQPSGVEVVILALAVVVLFIC